MAETVKVVALVLLILCPLVWLSTTVPPVVLALMGAAVWGYASGWLSVRLALVILESGGQCDG